MELLQPFRNLGGKTTKAETVTACGPFLPIILRSHYTVPKTNFTVLKTIISLKFKGFPTILKYINYHGRQINLSYSGWPLDNTKKIITHQNPINTSKFKALTKKKATTLLFFQSRQGGTWQGWRHLYPHPRPHQHPRPCPHPHQHPHYREEAMVRTTCTGSIWRVQHTPLILLSFFKYLVGMLTYW